MRVHLGGHLNWYDPDKRSWLEIDLPGAMSLVELARRLGLPPEEIAFAVVNGEFVLLSEEAMVVAGDQVELYPPVGGGNHRGEKCHPERGVRRRR